MIWLFIGAALLVVFLFLRQKKLAAIPAYSDRQTQERERPPEIIWGLPEDDPVIFEPPTGPVLNAAGRSIPQLVDPAAEGSGVFNDAPMTGAFGQVTTGRTVRTRRT